MGDGVHLIAIGLVLEGHSEVEGVVSVPEGHADPEEPSSRIFQSDSVPSATVTGLDDGFLVVFGDFAFAEDLAVFVDEDDLDDSVFLGDLDASLPDHVLPVVEVVALGGGQGRQFEDGDSFGLVAEQQLW
jgi:hypothetical protein